MIMTDWVFLGAMFVLFIINSVVQHRVGFRIGAYGGYSVGIFHAVNWLMKQNAINVENSVTGKNASAAELAKHILENINRQEFNSDNLDEYVKKLDEMDKK